MFIVYGTKNKPMRLITIDGKKQLQEQKTVRTATIFADKMKNIIDSIPGMTCRIIQGNKLHEAFVNQFGSADYKILKEF